MRVLSQYRSTKDVEHGSSWGFGGTLEDIKGYSKPSSIEEAERLDSLNRILAHLLQMDRVTNENGVACFDMRPSKVEDHSAYTPEVEAFIKEHGIEGVLNEAHVELERTFGKRLNLRYFLSRDPQDGTQILYVDIMMPSDEVETADNLLSIFGFDWWYDRLSTAGSVLGFRVVEICGV